MSDLMSKFAVSLAAVETRLSELEAEQDPATFAEEAEERAFFMGRVAAWQAAIKILRETEAS